MVGIEWRTEEGKKVKYLFEYANKKGDIARVAFYMSKIYGVVYSKRQQLLFEKWVKLDPISEEERKHNNKIIEVQKFGLKL